MILQQTSDSVCTSERETGEQVKFKECLLLGFAHAGLLGLLLACSLVLIDASTPTTRAPMPANVVECFDSSTGMVSTMPGQCP